ncbi:ABC transporter permease [Crassaminicella profunda]|uniref:ABC transporter permease n=1 Tax=Crassaminicella profunda TaxID=1286698 RepID=UPI001CA6578C|nr:ABC transporter permease [Crassaminicella profunda]QZY55204.1 ABC transporter permease [Crassaminicella profunda]
MTLWKISIKNIKRNFYNYFLYFASMVFSIMIYFTFTSIQYNEQVLRKSADSFKLDNVMSGSAIIVAIFAAIFIGYSNSFFTRKRKKEMALYSLMGVKKRQIGKMLFYENMIMGTFALFIGIALGSLLSKVFAMILLKLMGYATDISFLLSTKAIFNTICIFFILFIITSIHGYWIIYRFQLIDLFKSEKRREKEPKSSIILSFLSILLIGIGYWFSFKILDFDLKIDIFIKMLLTLAFTIIGTYLLFSSFLLFVIKLSRKDKKRYYKSINMIGTSQLLYRIKSNGKTLATIAILSATTLSAIGATYSLYYNNENNASLSAPFDYAYVYQDETLENAVEKTLLEYPENPLLDKISIQATRFDGEVLHSKYIPPALFAYNYDKKKSEHKVAILSESTFNEIAKIHGIKEKLKLDNLNQVVVIDDYYALFSDKFKLEGKNMEISLNGQKKQLTINQILQHSFINKNLLNGLPVIVKDSLYEKLAALGESHRVQGLIIDNKKDSADLTKALEKIIPKSARFSSFYAVYKQLLEIDGLFIFIGAFLGLVFLFATGSIIYFKQLTEAHNEKERYKILKRIGVEKKEIKASIAKQMLFVFLVPLVVGIVHSFMALKNLGTLGRFEGVNLLIPFSLSTGLYALIYFVFYIFTVNSYYKVIHSEK